MTCDRPAGHRHGTTDAHSEGCRCPDTLAVHDFRMAKKRRRHRQQQLGLYTPDVLIDAGEVRAHIKKLVKAKNRPERIAEIAGVSLSGLNKIRSGTGKVRTSTAERILAFQGDIAASVRAGDVPALATTRRLQALAALGHTAVAIAEYATVPADTKDRASYLRSRASLLKRIRSGEHKGTDPQIEADVIRAYDALWNAAPDRSHKNRAAGSTLMAKRAAQMGWLPPMYLDDDRMGDPSYKPRIPYLTRHNDAQELIPR